MSKPLPKSLHTVTVLVMLARRLMQSSQHTAPSAIAAVDMALSILGYDDDTIDSYGLKAQAVAKLNK